MLYCCFFSSYIFLLLALKYINTKRILVSTSFLPPTFFVASAMLEENEQHEKQWMRMKNEMAHLYLMELYKNNFEI